MASVDILVTGYVREATGGDEVQGTISLVRSGDAVIVVDPGLLRDRTDLVAALQQHQLEVGDVSHVFLTHHHVDHTRNVGMFPRAVVVDHDSTYAGDVWSEHSGDGYLLADDVTILQTPGHSLECASLLVATATQTVVLTHAWWFSDMTPVEDPLAADQGTLEVSRRRILQAADVVVPGHGAPFFVKSTPVATS